MKEQMEAYDTKRALEKQKKDRNEEFEKQLEQLPGLTPEDKIRRFFDS